MGICRALLKYGYSNFQLEILEYCESGLRPHPHRRRGRSKCIEREDYYLNLFNSYYNISLKPGAPMYGRLHTEESKKIMSVAKKGDKNPMFGKGRPKGAGKAAKIEVFDIDTGVTTLYESISEACRALDIPQGYIYTYFSRNQLKPYRPRKRLRSSQQLSRCLLLAGGERQICVQKSIKIMRK
jgi:hypothetical protein